MIDGVLSEFNIPLAKAVGTFYSETKNTMSKGEMVDNIFCSIQITQDLVGGSIKATLQTTDDPYETSPIWKDLMISQTLTAVQAKAGTMLFSQRMPKGIQKAFRVKFDISGSATTAGECAIIFSDIM